MSQEYELKFKLDTQQFKHFQQICQDLQETLRMRLNQSQILQFLVSNARIHKRERANHDRENST